MLLAFGMVCALLEAKGSGQGQVVDAAMVDGAATLMAMMHGMLALGVWADERGTNILDGGAHFYDTYETADGRYVSIGAIEPQFYAELLRLTGLTTTRPAPPRWTAPSGRSSRSGSPRCSRARPGTSGPRSWRGRTSASPPY